MGPKRVEMPLRLAGVTAPAIAGVAPARPRATPWRRAARMGILLVLALLLLALVAPQASRAASWWVPAQNETWQWDLAAPVDQTVDTQINDVDLWTNEASVVASLHAQGRHVVCYLDAGTWEGWRPDASKFPTSVRGKEDPGWTDEKWLDIRALSILEPLMEKRMKLCRQKGFDAVDADNVDAWQYSEEGETGFGAKGTLTAEEQLTYNKWLASEAHSLGLGIALKSDTNQIAELQPYFDFSVDEECIEWSPDCELLEPFIKAGKPVFEDEYINKVGVKSVNEPDPEEEGGVEESVDHEEPSEFCPNLNARKFMAEQKDEDLDGWNDPCWPQGNWVGTKGTAGYDLAGFNGSSDLINMPGVTVTLAKGSRLTWASPTTDTRALENPDGSSRSATAYSDPSEVQVQLHFSNAYQGNLHLYAVDWDSKGRRETITADGQTAKLTLGNFSQGEWVSVPINVAAGATVPINVTRTAGTSAVLSGIMLGDAGPAVSSAPEGNWVGTYGSAGYDLADWDGVQDLSDMPNATATLTKGSRYQWAANSTDTRALQSPDGLSRSAATYYDPNELKLQLSFPTAYTGNLHLYAVDWDSTARRETITVNGKTAQLSSNFNGGAWVVFPISVAAKETVTITVDRTAGANAVLSGIFLGESHGEGNAEAIAEGGNPPQPAVASTPQGAWVKAVGSAGYDLAGWDGPSGDISYLPDASLSLEQGSRFQWAANTTDARALSDPTATTRNAGTYYDPNQIKVKLTFKEAYTGGTLHLYALDWDSTARRELITVNGQTAVLSSSFHEGAWVSFPISVAAGGTVTISVDRTAGANAVLSGIFLGEAGAPAAAPVSSAPQGNWVETYGKTGYDLLAFKGSSDEIVAVECVRDPRTGQSLHLGSVHDRRAGAGEPQQEHTGRRHPL